MKLTQQQIENLRTLQEQLDSALHETAQENTLLAESAAIQEKIDNIKLPEIDTTELAKESTLQELLNRFAHYDSATGDLTIENVNITIE